jgi:hypothetical protein
MYKKYNIIQINSNLKYVFENLVFGHLVTVA